MNVVDFEKDDDKNFHIDFIHSAANIRAAAHKIETVDRLECKLVAGRIIPAMITTTAVVAGLSCLEMIKIHREEKLPIESFCDTFVNLGMAVLESHGEADSPPSSSASSQIIFSSPFDSSFLPFL